MKKQLNPKYDHLQVEKDKYQYWLDKNLFKADINSNKPKFSIILPPPNVTGKLHIGHAWDTSLQDAIIRFKKLTGYDTLFLPGMDHSGISTQVKVEAKLKQQGIDKNKLGREKFLLEAWKWKEEYANIIRKQWAKLGLSLDYSTEKFTLDEDINQIVKEIFVKFYNDQIIYKDKQIVNWDPEQKTAISNVEVIYKETQSKMYYFKYMLEDSDKYLTVATTRPETMFADQCLVVNPNDSRYQKYINKKVINPVNKQVIPIISDEYVDIEFGTGVMKCTPAHDLNDYHLAIKHNLKMPICLNIDGSVNQLGGKYQGLDRFVARKEIIKNAIDEDLFVKEEDIINQVGFSERSNAIVEPYLSDQWFVKMDKFKNMVIDLQNSDNKINFYPNRFSDVLNRWMTDAHDWCISRQLWWGHQIPCWYHKKTNEMYVGINPPSDIENWTQDQDVLDTWFSSGLWAFSTLLNNKGLESEYFKNYFPTSVLVTGYDIIFFWVARMIFQTLEYTKQIPFKDVLIHGLVRDELNRKMSKSLGNGIDPMDVINNNGCDSLRLFLLTNSTPGQDIRYSNEKILASWNFINKLWNASRYVFLNLDKDFKFDQNFYKTDLEITNQWILTELSKTQAYVYEKMNKYEFSLAGNHLWDFVWNKYCSWYIEFSKVNLNNDKFNHQTKQTLFYVLKEILIMLHPLIPFVSEEIYLNMMLKESILLEQWTNLNSNYDTSFIDDVIKMITSIREFRNTKNIKNDVCLSVNISNTNQNHTKLFKKHFGQIYSFLINFCNTKLVDDVIKNKTSLSIDEYFIEIANDSFINKNELIKELEQKQNHLNNEITRSQKILNNQEFIKKAKPEKIQSEKIKYQNYLDQLQAIKDKLKELKND
ncbi:valine--tRNA ligase [Mycoplasma mycoides]|uniref:valine--tRNA ligase n=1 Tax=Mycoplasma mycoides TaxID=2102 RepID=UPI00223FD785|nr:valine--tRNA ligase [Mycoplasma mycoides]QVK03026.1 valine--tRNA ligase [Mycoplasma mycoides subsp. capri]QVK03843.1 valine--tRNA ligase [Mycoplasma mycoides subsp. capri]